LCNPANAAGNISRGEGLYRGCQDCHSIEKNDVGPMHKGIVGRAAGTVPGYNYSPALRNAKIIWTEQNLDKWLTNPQGAYSRDKNVLRSQECSGPCRYHRIPQRTRALTAKKIDKFSRSNRSRVVGRL
jgi:Cytochrome c